MQRREGMVSPQTSANIKTGLVLAGFCSATYVYTIFKMRKSIEMSMAEFSDQPGSAQAGAKAK